MRENQLYLKDIAGAIHAIKSFVADMSFEEFIKDDKTVSAVIRKLEIIGEASKAVPQDIRDRYPQIPWKEMARMRDKLIHFYFGVDHALLWRAIKYRIPEIYPLIMRILSEDNIEKNV